MTRLIRIGSRGSLLALAQAKEIQKNLQKNNRKLRFKIVTIKTTGDEYQTVELFKKNNVGIFTNEIEKKLFSREIDIAVHSLKDLPTDLPNGLILAAYPKRLDTRDVLISKKRFTLKTLPRGASVGTGSPRRKEQLRLARPDLKLFDIRGNLDTRIGFMLKGDFDAIVLAYAGLMRLNKYLKYAIPIPHEQMLPAVGQGALGLEVRSNDMPLIEMLKKLNHEPSQMQVSAERAFLKALHGGCRVPVGIHTQIKAGKIYLEAKVFSSTQGFLTASVVATEPEAAGIKLAKNLLDQGADQFLLEARS